MAIAPVATDSLVARPLTVVYRPIGHLVPDPRNARTHPKRQIDQIAGSIAAFGFTNPILADPEGHLIAGHGRLLAAKQLGLSEVPVIELATRVSLWSIRVLLDDTRYRLSIDLL